MTVLYISAAAVAVAHDLLMITEGDYLTSGFLSSLHFTMPSTPSVPLPVKLLLLSSSISLSLPPLYLPPASPRLPLSTSG